MLAKLVLTLIWNRHHDFITYRGSNYNLEIRTQGLCNYLNTARHRVIKALEELQELRLVQSFSAQHGTLLVNISAPPSASVDLSTGEHSLLGEVKQFIDKSNSLSAGPLKQKLNKFFYHMNLPEEYKGQGDKDVR